MRDCLEHGVPIEDTTFRAWRVLARVRLNLNENDDDDDVDDDVVAAFFSLIKLMSYFKNYLVLNILRIKTISLP